MLRDGYRFALQDEANGLRESMNVNGHKRSMVAKSSTAVRGSCQTVSHIAEPAASKSSRGEIVGERYVTHPAVDSLRKIGREAAVLCDSLGLSPQARQRLGFAALRDPQPPDEIDRLKSRRAKKRGEYDQVRWGRGDDD